MFVYLAHYTIWNKSFNTWNVGKNSFWHRKGKVAVSEVCILEEVLCLMELVYNIIVVLWKFHKLRIFILNATIIWIVWKHWNQTVFWLYIFSELILSTRLFWVLLLDFPFCHQTWHCIMFQTIQILLFRDIFNVVETKSLHFIPVSIVFLMQWLV